MDSRKRKKQTVLSPVLSVPPLPVSNARTTMFIWKIRNFENNAAERSDQLCRTEDQLAGTVVAPLTRHNLTYHQTKFSLCDAKEWDPSVQGSARDGAVSCDRLSPTKAKKSKTDESETSTVEYIQWNKAHSLCGCCKRRAGGCGRALGCEALGGSNV